MKTHIKKLFLLRALIAGLGMLLAGRVGAQTFMAIHLFASVNDAVISTNIDGAAPTAELTLSGDTLYGTTYAGCTNGYGDVFAINTGGNGFKVLHCFNALNDHTNSDESVVLTNSDGANPDFACLLLSGNTLYGTAENGGTNGNGTVFAINTDGTGFTTVYSFPGFPDYHGTNSAGAHPQAGLILSGDTLYGTTYAGGTKFSGTVFAVNTNGTDFTVLHSFGAANVLGDGSNPTGGLILSGNTLYGTTTAGGTNGNGAVFALNTDGMGYTNLHNFNALNYHTNSNGTVVQTNSDGWYPQAGLVLSGNTLYGMAQYGGTNSYGTVFAVNTDGTGFTVLHTFSTQVTNAAGWYTNSDGANPQTALFLSGNILYGTAESGGNDVGGTVFSINTDGTGFTVLHSFTGFFSGNKTTTTNAGYTPVGGVILSSNTLYGTTEDGGGIYISTVFALSLPVPLSMGITTAGNKIVLSWPTNATGVNLQSNANLSTGTWGNVTSGIAIVGANYVFTNTANGSAAFFRLNQP